MKTFFSATLFAGAVLADSIKSVTYGGSGCPGGSISLPEQPTFPTVDLVYPKFKAVSTPGGSFIDARKNCQANIDYMFDAPAARSLLVKTILHIELAAGATATQKSTYYVSGSANQKVLSSDLTGPLSKSVLYTDRIPLSSLSDTPLTGEVALNVNTAINFGLGDNTGSLTIKSTEITLEEPGAAIRAVNRESIEN